MIDYDKLFFWIGCQFDDIKEAYNKNPSDYMFGCLKSYEAILAQLNLVCAAISEEEPQNEFCEHLCEGITHVFSIEGGSFTMQKCIKCGEFYK